jgi:cytochrome c biogenesis protein CcdA
MSVIGFCLLMTIVFIILGIIGYRIQDNFYGIVEIIGMVIMSISIFFGATFFGLTIFTGYKNITMPVEERNFKVEYETVKQMQTSSSDLRDATYTEKLLKINQKINEAREYCNDPFWGCINSKEIASYELLEKER